MKVKSWMAGLKIHNIPRFLKSVAWDLGLEIKIIERDKGFIRETVYFELEGKSEDLDNFNLIVKRKVNECNQ